MGGRRRKWPRLRLRLKLGAVGVGGDATAMARPVGVHERPRVAQQLVRVRTEVVSLSLKISAFHASQTFQSSFQTLQRKHATLHRQVIQTVVKLPRSLSLRPGLYFRRCSAALTQNIQINTVFFL